MKRLDNKRFMMSNEAASKSVSQPCVITVSTGAMEIQDDTGCAVEMKCPKCGRPLRRAILTMVMPYGENRCLMTGTQFGTLVTRESVYMCDVSCDKMLISSTDDTEYEPGSKEFSRGG